MGSKGWILHRKHPSPGISVVHPQLLGTGIQPPPGRYPAIDLLPPLEMLDQKLASQHVDLETLAIENQRLAATHGALRHEITVALQELQILQSRIQVVKSEREQQTLGILEKIAKMEVGMQSASRLKLDLQQARSEAQSLAEVRQELI